MAHGLETTSTSSDALRLKLDEQSRSGARIKVVGVGGLADHVGNPSFAASVGLVVYAHRNIQAEPRVGAGAIGKITGRLRTLFKEFF